MMKVLPYNTPNALLSRVKVMSDLFKLQTPSHNPAPIKKTFPNDTIEYYIYKPYLNIKQKIWGMDEAIFGHNILFNKETRYDKEGYQVCRHIPNYGCTGTYYNKDGIRFAKKLSKGEDTVYLKKRDNTYYLYDSHGVNPRECSLEEFESEMAKHNEA